VTQLPPLPPPHVPSWESYAAMRGLESTAGHGQLRREGAREMKGFPWIIIKVSGHLEEINRYLSRHYHLCYSCVKGNRFSSRLFFQMARIGLRSAFHFCYCCCCVSRRSDIHYYNYCVVQHARLSGAIAPRTDEQQIVLIVAREL
jgi:hypothetical protein